MMTPSEGRSTVSPFASDGAQVLRLVSVDPTMSNAAEV
jgi:hypothetical protein